MTTSVNEDKDEQKIIEDTSFYSSTEYIEMDARHKKERDIRHIRDIRRQKKKTRQCARFEIRNQTRRIKERILYSK
jgi:hypothetical protein